MIQSANMRISCDSKILSKKHGDLWGFMNRNEHFANKAWGLVETWTSEEPTKTGLKQIRMGKPANHMHETWPNPSQLAGAYHCGSLFRLGLVLHLAAGQCLCDVLRVADCRWRCFRFETCLVERKTEGLKVKHHQSSWTINKHQPSTMMLKDLFPTLAHGHQHGLFSRWFSMWPNTAPRARRWKPGIYRGRWQELSLRTILSQRKCWKMLKSSWGAMGYAWWIRLDHTWP